jgi:hypothetical protein
VKKRERNEKRRREGEKVRSTEGELERRGRKVE